MDIALIFKSVVGLIVLLAILIIIFILPARKRKVKKRAQERKEELHQKAKEEILAFDELRAIVRRSSSSREDLERAVEQIVKHYVKIHPKLGIRTHPEFDKYVDLIVHLVRHRNTSKELILKLDRELTKNNPEYKAELNDTLSKALNSLGG